MQADHDINPDLSTATAVEAERFLIPTDPIAQTWMNFKHENLEKWLQGMRRLQAKIEAEGNSWPRLAPGASMRGHEPGLRGVSQASSARFQATASSIAGLRSG